MGKEKTAKSKLLKYWLSKTAVKVIPCYSSVCSYLCRCWKLFYDEK